VERQAARQGHRVGPVGQHCGANVPFGEGDFPRRRGSIYSPALGIRHGEPALGHHGAASPLRKHRLHGVGVQEVIGVEQEDHIAASDPTARVDRGGHPAVLLENGAHPLTVGSDHVARFVS
jgi:hypothetical protein